MAGVVVVPQGAVAVVAAAAASPLVASCKELQPHQSGRRLPPKI
jgi:hypothetical protein